MEGGTGMAVLRQSAQYRLHEVTIVIQRLVLFPHNSYQVVSVSPELANSRHGHSGSMPMLGRPQGCSRMLPGTLLFISPGSLGDPCGTLSDSGRHVVQSEALSKLNIPHNGGPYVGEDFAGGSSSDASSASIASKRIVGICKRWRLLHFASETRTQKSMPLDNLGDNVFCTSESLAAHHSTSTFVVELLPLDGTHRTVAQRNSGYRRSLHHTLLLRPLQDRKERAYH